MRQHRRDKTSLRATRTYAWLLRLYPRAHRQAFGEQMVQAFQDHYRDAVEEDGQRAPHFWLGVMADEGKNLLREHLAALRGRTSVMNTSVMQTWKPALLMSLPIALVYSLSWVFYDSVGRRQDALLLPSTIVLLLLLASWMRTISPSDIGRSWVRIVLVAGGLMALYYMVLNLLAAVVPLPPLSDDFRFNEDYVWNLTLPRSGADRRNMRETTQP
jgi:hypothetical protein